jgi:NAD(P)-dependent dehydrogenase (short-subunit alcohol dehydrogenase family)
MNAIIPARGLFDLSGETVLVTGASSGLGARFAEVLAVHGAHVVAAARRTGRLAALAERVANVHPLALDVTAPEGFAGALATAERMAGPLTLLVNNAGVANSGSMLDTDAAEWERVRQSNVDGVWHLSQAFAKHLIAADRPGAIINIASVLSYRVTPGTAAYAISKAAVKHMTEAMAAELARYRIRVNALAPGYIVTEMTDAFLNSPASAETRKRIPMRRVGTPADLDGALLLLAAPRASAYMTGSTIVVDGGHLTAFR